MTVSVLVNHSPWRPERVRALAQMMPELPGADLCIHDKDYRDDPLGWQGGAKEEWVFTQWAWGVGRKSDHVLFLSDDLNLCPSFLKCLQAVLEVAPEAPIALLANHPSAEVILASGVRFYATNSWVTGPGYCLPRAMLSKILDAYLEEPQERRVGPTSWNDDNFVNEWVTRKGPGRTLTPIPGLIEHRRDVESTVGHGDDYSHERVSWRRPPWPTTLDLADPATWALRGGPSSAPMLQLPGVQ